MAINTSAALSPDILLNPSPGCIILSGLKTLNSIISEIFANGEQGFAYDPNDLSTMFQDAVGTVPVTGAGEPVGLVLDKSKGLVIGNELIPDYNFDTDTTAINFIVRGTKTYLSASKSAKVTTTSLSGAIGLAFSPVDPLFVTSGTYKVEIKLNEYSVANTNARLTVKKSSGQNSNVNPSQVITCNGIGVFSGYLHVNAGDTLTIIEEVASTVGDFFTIDYISAKLISGNHAYQTTSSMRPLLVASPQRLDYDTVDDKLITNLPAQLTGCTVIRSVPNVGTQILTGQTIPTTYEDNQDHCGLIVINRALTATETSQITAIFNKAAGV